MALRRLLILGGSTGIGEAAYLRCSKEFGTFEKILRYGSKDFDARDDIELQTVIRGFIPTDVIFSVGVNQLDWIGDITRGDFRLVMETNVWSFLNLLNLLRNSGSWPVNVVAVTSDAAWRPMRTSAVYCASKAALEMAVRVASREMAPKGWRVNAVAPGKVADTPMTDYVDARVLELRGWTVEQADDYEAASSPLSRPVLKEEVADVIFQVLQGPRAQTGEIIAVNGGR